MSKFQFKVSSLKKLNEDTKNQETEKIASEVTTNKFRLFSKTGHSCDSSNISQFFIDESELWNDVDKDIFEFNKKDTELENNKASDVEKKKILRKSIEKNKKEGCKNPDDISHIENKREQLVEVDFNINDCDFKIPSEEEPCFDLSIESNDELEDIRLENSQSPTFDVSYKSVCKKFGTNYNNKKNYSPEKSPKLEDEKINVSESKLSSFDFMQEILNPLDLAEETDIWLEKILQNEAFSNISLETPEQKLQNNLIFLNKTYVEILEKMVAAFESLPIKMLEIFPKFDQDVFVTLKTTRRRIKAVTIKTENLMKRKNMSLLSTDNKSFTISGEIINQSKCVSQVEKEILSQKDFSKVSYSSFNDLNNSLEESFANKPTNGVFTFKQPSKSQSNSVSNKLDHSKSNFTVLNSSKQNISSNSDCQTNFHSSVPLFPKSNTFSNSNYQMQLSSLEEAEKKSTSLSVIDYTDVLYKTPVKDCHQKTLSNGGKFQNNMKNDGVSGEFDGLNFPHSNELVEKFHKKFGLKSFRPNQLQVINAALLGFDCFVLMPTGGGKSLCYQLPALVTKGVTVVISPLRSLILDQVTKLLTLDISAAHLSGDIKEFEANLIYRKLNQPEPTIKLLYVTPEKVGASTSLRNCLLGLYKRSMLARFVIDEAHCVSQWGHDFRPDYKKLRELRENFPQVNIMALTATATPRVRTDILHQLKMKNPKWFLSSFNRSNLTYSVKEKKGKSTLKEIANLIQKEFKKDTGVIYCFSRKECEDVAKDLKEYGIIAIPYHAGLNDNERTRAQNLWMNDKVKVVCATIAFGMGIDKLDVRFVIHFSLPKSIEGYYQESGRAGRDGEKATCILYYSYRDKIRMLKLINMDQSMANQAARKVHIDNLFRVVAFAENKTDCRRALQLEYFGEKFDRKTCVENRSTACDNCLYQGVYETIDVTTESKAIVTTVKQVCGSDDQKHANFTMLHFVDVFKGTLLKKVLSEGHDNLPAYGLGKSWQRLDVERLFRKLIMEEFLKERLMVKDDGITFAYIKFGRRGEELLKGNIKIMFEVKKRKGSATAPGNHVKIEESVDPAVLEIQEKCYSDLMNAIHEIASSVNCNPNAIMNVQALRAMSFSLPETAEEMLSINHVTTANYEKYGSILLEITKKYAAEKKALGIPEIPEEDIFINEPWSSKKIDDSPYFETEITFMGKNGKKRKKSNNFRKWQNTKKWKGSNSSSKTGSSKSKKTNSKTNSNPSGITTIPGAKFSTMMELPTSKANGFARPKVILKNL